MFKQILTLAATVTLVSQAFSSEGWVTNLDEAKKQAAAQNKDLLIEFTGSDWCPPCKMLKAKVFDTKEFKDFTKEGFILVELDFPRQKQLEPAAAAANQKAQMEYQVNGFPTVILATADGKPYGGFIGGRDNIEDVKNIINDGTAKKTDIQMSLKQAKELTGDDKLKALANAFKAIPKEYQSFYTDLKQEILALDPQDTTGFVKAENLAKLLQKEQEEISKAINEAMPKDLKEGPEAIAIILKTAEGLLAKDYQVATKVELHQLRFQYFMMDTKLDEAIAELDKIIGLDPDGKDGTQSKTLKKHISDNKEKIIEQINAQKAQKAKKAQTK